MASYRLKINTKLILALLLTGVPISFGFMHYLNDTVKDAFYEIEDNRVKTILGQIESYLENQIEQQSSKLNDWAKWDDAHFFVLGQNSDFVYSNLRNPENVYKNLKTDFVAFNNMKGDFLYAKSYDLEKLAYDSKINHITPFLKTLKPGQEYSGYNFDPVTKQYYYFVSLATTTTDLNSKPSGNMIAGAYINDSFLRTLKEVTKYEIRVLDPVISETIDKVEDNLLVARKNVVHSKQDKPLFSIELKLDRPINMIFLSVFKTIQFAIGICFLVFSFVIYTLINRSMIRRLKYITRWLSDFEETKSYKPLDLEQNDELTDTVKALNKMAHNIQKYHLQIEEKNQRFAMSSKMAAIGTMTTELTKEVSEPLLSLKTQLSQIQSQSTMSDILKGALDNIDRISKSIENIRDFSQTKEDFRSFEFSLSEVLTDTIESCKASLATSRVDISLVETEDALIRGSAMQLSQVILNLIYNSKEAIQNFEEKWIKISTQRSFDNLIEIRITDSGKGIPKNIVDQMMNPFFTTKTDQNGKGLGLSISKGIIESLSGALYYDDTCKNTRFIIELPCKKASLKAS